MDVIARGGFVEHNDGGSRRRRGSFVATGVGLTALVALTAGLVIAFGPSHSGPADTTAAPGTSHSARTVAGAPAGATPSPAGTAAEPAPTGAAPAGRLTGHVSKGVHSGDLRFFLLTPPGDADVYGDPAGEALSADDISSAAVDPAEARAALKTYGFRGGAYRTYLTADGVCEVTVKLARFGAPDQAAAYYEQGHFQGARIALAGAYPARAYRLTSASAESSDAVAAVSYQGDVQITLTVSSARTLSGGTLQRLLDAQYERLTTGR